MDQCIEKGSLEVIQKQKGKLLTKRHIEAIQDLMLDHTKFKRIKSK